MPNSIEIPWKKFGEEEIQTFIAMLFHSLDYHIQELHKSDRANESGADIVVKKSDESIAIAVKIKPSHEDRYQLIELSRRQEKRKIYVYIETPTKKFLDSMQKDGKEAEFWDIKKLNDFFVSKNLYFTANIIFDNHSVNGKLSVIQYLLYTLWKEANKAKKIKIKQLNKKSFFMLWRLKDMAVTLHQTNSLIEQLFETPIINKNQELNLHFLKIFLDYLDILESRIAEFLNFFVQFHLKNKELVNNSIAEQNDRSHWLWISHHQPLNNLHILKRELKEAIRDKKLYSELATKLSKVPENKKLKRYQEEMAKGNDIWQAIHKKLKDLSIFGSGVEEVIDDIVKEYFRDYDTLSGMKQFDNF